MSENIKKNVALEAKKIAEAVGNEVADKSAEKAAVKDAKNDRKEADKMKKPKSHRFYRFLRLFLNPINRFLWPTEIVNKENMDKVAGGEIIVCNHYTTVDAIIPMRCFFKYEMHVVIKSEAFECAKIADWFLAKMGGIPIHRGEADINAVKSVMQVLKDDKKLLIFPEGTRNKEGTKVMLPFKDGAARFALKTKKPILPMIYYSSPKIFRKNYLYVGEPLSLEQFYELKKADGYDTVTQYLRDKMDETRTLCDAYVENKKKKKH